MDQTAGSGPDSLVLRISQDAYRGNAQYTIPVDGTQIGGTLTAELLHSSGQSDNVTVRGDWAAGSHTVQIDFLNDAYDGSAATDRNLYVDGASYNSAAVGGRRGRCSRRGRRVSGSAMPAAAGPPRRRPLSQRLQRRVTAAAAAARLRPTSAAARTRWSSGFRRTRTRAAPSTR
jgi:Ca-dependent carbohydrate-binding module xylan-binding